MTIRVIVNGAQGKMGVLACTTIKAHPDFELVAELTKNNNLGKEIRHTNAQIVIDLTRADVVYANTLEIIEQGAHPVIGTSGLTPEQINTLTTLCKRRALGGIIAPNFSIGAVLMTHFSAQAARFFNNVEIVETHHPKKYDSPSGTAIQTAEKIAQNWTTSEHHEHRELIPGVRGGRHQTIPIHSLRLDGVIAKQDVIFGNLGETLTITHNCTDRVSFMAGILLCCQKVVDMNSLVYGLENFIL